MIGPDIAYLSETTPGETVSRPQKGIVARKKRVFLIAALEMEEIKKLPTFPGLSEDPSPVGLLRIEEQLVSITTTMVHRQQYHTS